MPLYLKYGDIKGDVTEPGHSGYIELMSAQWGVGRGVSSPTGGSADREPSVPSVSEIVVTKRSDSASNRLLNESVSGEPVTAAIDFVRSDDPSVYLRLEMSGTMISAWSISSNKEDPIESLTLNFTKIDFKNNPGTPPP